MTSTQRRRVRRGKRREEQAQNMLGGRSRVRQFPGWRAAGGTSTAPCAELVLDFFCAFLCDLLYARCVSALKALFCLVAASPDQGAVLSILLAAALLLPAAPGATRPQYGGTLRIELRQNPSEKRRG